MQKSFKVGKTPLNVALRKTDVTSWLLLHVIIISTCDSPVRRDLSYDCKCLKHNLQV